MQIDWQQLTLHIRRAGVPLSRAANLVGSDWRHLGRLARGEVQQPRWLTGVRLLDLHHDLCGCREIVIPDRHADSRR